MASPLWHPPTSSSASTGKTVPSPEDFGHEQWVMQSFPMAYPMPWHSYAYAGYGYPSLYPWPGAEDGGMHSAGSKRAGSKRPRHKNRGTALVVGEEARKQGPNGAGANTGQTLAGDRVGAAKKPSKDKHDTLGLGDQAQELKDKLDVKVEAKDPEAGKKKRERQEALESLKGKIWTLAQEPQGSRVVQAAFQDNNATEQELVGELESHVREAIPSPHANYVIQKAIEVFSENTIGFIFQELEGHGHSVACHRYGCRIMVKLMQEFSELEAVRKLFDEALVKAIELCRHNFGRHVAEIILEKGTPEQRSKVEHALRESLLENAKDRHASYVVEKVLKSDNVSEAVIEEFANTLLGDNLTNVSTLAQNQFGFYALKSLLEGRSDTVRRTVLDHLEGLKLDAPEKEMGLVRRMIEELQPGGSLAPTSAA